MNDIEREIYNILDPEIGLPIGKLGMVESTNIKDNLLEVKIKLTVPNCPLSKDIEKEVNEIAEKHGLKAVVEFSTMNREELEYAKQVIYSEKKGLPEYIKKYEKGKIKNIIGIFSSKGGVGKSTVTSLFAIFLAKKGYKVGLLDGDVASPSIATLFGIEESCSRNKSKIVPIEKFGIKFVGRDLVIGRGLGIWRGPIISNLIKSLYTETDWGELDFLLVDFPPGTNDVPITAMQSIPLDWIILVTTPSKLSLNQLDSSILMAETFGIKTLAIIGNMGNVEGADMNIPIIEDIEEKIPKGETIDFSPILKKLEV